jgi:hypothetical protein
MLLGFVLYGYTQDLSGQQTFEVRHFAGSPGGLGSADGFGPAARFRNPFDIWGDGTYLYVSDQSGYAIRRVTIATAEVRLIAGSSNEGGSQDGIGTAARFRGASGLWGDGVYLYIADKYNFRIRRMTIATAEVVTIAGQSSATADGPIFPGTFRGPLDVWGHGQFLYVADDGTYGLRGLVDPGALRKIDLVANTVTTVAVPVLTGRNSVPRGLWGDGRELFIAYDQGLLVAMNLTTNAFRVVTDLTTPDLRRTVGGLWSGTDGFLYAASSTAEILRIDKSTGEIRSILGTANSQDWIEGTGSQARFRNPAGIWSDGDHLYICDFGNHAIRIADFRTSVVTTFAGVGLRVADGADVQDPLAGVSWSDGMYLYFSASNRIYKIPITGSSAAVVAGTGIAGSRDGSPDVAQFNNPQAIWGDGTYLYVSDKGNRTIRKVAIQTHEVTTLAGSPGNGEAVDGVGLEARLSGAEGLWGDGTNLYVSDGALIRRITLATGAVQTVAGGYPSPGSIDGIGLSARFADPRGVWGDAAYLYIMDRIGRRVRRMSLDTYEVTTLASVGGYDVWGDGVNLYITGLYEILRLSLVDNEVSTLAGAPTPGRDDGIGSQARFYSASSIWGVGDTLYVNDGGRVRTLDVHNGAVATIAGRKTINADGAGMGARFNGPTGIWGDGTSLYVTDRYSNTLRQIDLRTREVRTVAGFTGESGVSDGIGDRARFWDPQGICGNGAALYVASNGTVRKITVGTWEVSTFAVGGQFEKLYGPAGLWCDAASIYVADTYGHAIRRIDVATQKVTTVLSGLAGPTQIWGDARFLYFSNQFGRTIMKFDLATMELNTFVASVPFENLGGGSFWGDDRYLYIPFGHSIRRVDKSTGEMTNLAGSDTLFGTEDGIGEAARFQKPGSVWGDGRTLYVADFLNNAIRTVTLLPPLVSGSSVAFELPAFGSTARTTIGADQPLRVGYARVQADSSGRPPAAIAVFGFHSNGVLVSETGVPAVSTLLTGRIYAETAGVVRTGLAIANPNSNAVNLSFYFTDAQGHNFGRGMAILEANQQAAAFLDEQPFSTTNLLERPISMAKTFTFSASQPVAAIALRGFVNERGEFLMTTLPVADTSRTTSETTVIPHFAEGGGWTTQVVLVNSSDTDTTGTLQFFGQSGATTETQTYAIAARSSVNIRRSSTGTAIRVGSIHVIPDSGGPTPVGLSIFSYSAGGITVTETGVPTLTPASALNIYAERSASLRSGFAIANATSQDVTISFDVISSDGRSSGVNGTLSLPANGQRSLFLNELPGAQALPADFGGLLRIAAPEGSAVSAIGLRTRSNERAEFLVSTTMPQQNSTDSPNELYVPHFVEGGGYTTEFILIDGSSSSSASGSIRFYSQSGQSITLTLQ